MANSLEQFILPDRSRNNEMIGWHIIDRPSHFLAGQSRKGRAAIRDACCDPVLRPYFTLLNRTLLPSASLVAM